VVVVVAVEAVLMTARPMTAAVVVGVDPRAVGDAVRSLVDAGVRAAGWVGADLAGLGEMLGELFPGEDVVVLDPEGSGAGIAAVLSAGSTGG
jgi:hypothetical protein